MNMIWEKTGFRGLVLVEFLKSKLLEFVVFRGVLCFCQVSSGSHWVLNCHQAAKDDRSGASGRPKAGSGVFDVNEVFPKN